MKKLALLFLVTVFCNQLFSQASCGSSAAFCAGQTAVSFPAGVNNGSAAAGPDYGCLGSEPNPSWYYFQVSQSGSIIISIAGAGGSDVDFVCWGPFSSQAAACGGLTSNCSPGCPTNVGNPNFYPSGNMVDCSYSASPTETCTINNAISGQFYMLLLTNFSNQPQNINFNQTGGTGSTNCGLLTSSVISQTICAGRTATLFANSNVVSPTYVWNPGGATTSSISVSPSVTTVYSVSISGMNSSGTPTVVTNSGTVTVNTVPNFTLGTNSPVCQGSPITFTATAALGNYTWTGPPINSVTALGSLTLPNANVNMTGTYTVMGKTAQGCTVSATAPVNVIQTGTVTVVPTTTVCQGSPVLLTSNSVPVATTYSWSGPASYTSAVQNPTITNSQPSQSGTYTVTAGFTLGAKTCTRVNTCTVTVSALPTVTLSSNSLICQGATLNLTSTAGSSSYTWTGPPALTQTTSVGSLSIPNADPTMAGDYTVTASSAQGCASTATTTVGVIATGSITVVPTTTVCENETVFLTANSVPPATVYNWSGPNSFTTAVQNPTLTNAVPSQSGTYTVIADFAMGGTTCTMSAVSSVSVFALPVVTLANNGIVCQGSNIKLNSTPGLAAYNWTGPAGFNQTTTADSLILPNADVSMQGNYTVLAQTVEGCTATATASVEVIQTGSVTVTPFLSACQGSVINLTASSNPVADSYDWSGPLSYSISAANPVLNNVLPAQSGIYSVTASFTSGTVTCTMANTSTVNVIPAPAINLSPMAPVCNNGDINLNAPGGGSSYLWGGPNSYTSTDQNPVIHNASVINQGTYSLTVTSSGCVNKGSVNVNVYATLNFLSVPTSITLCEGKTGSLGSNGGSGGSGSYNYVWSPTTGLSSPNTAATGVTGIATTNYTLTLSDAICPITLAPTTTVTVIVNPTPVITFTTTINRGCEPFCTDLISNSVPASVNCVWQFSNSTGLNSCGTPNFCFPVHGTYDASLTVTDVNGCVDSIRQTAFILVDPKPEPSFDYLPTNPTILINEVNYNDHSTVGTPMQSWHWNFGDYNLTQQNDTSNVQNPSHIYDYAGTYTVNLEVVNSFGCMDNVSRIVVVEEEFAFYIPNAFSPTKAEGKNDVFMVQGMGFIPDGFEMTIYDRWGTVVFKTNDVTKGWDGSIKGGALGKEGVYVYKILVLDSKNREKEFIGHITLL